MLIFDPNYIYDIGFQLSFLAMLSIFIYYPLIEKIYIKESINIKDNEKVTFIMRFIPWKNRLIALKIEKIIVSILSILNVSLSAQILTMPLSIYYFNIFPISFILSNLIVIPLMMPLIILTIIYILFRYTTGSDLNFIAISIDYIIDLINNTASFFAKNLSPNLLEHIYLDNIHLMIIILLIITLSIFIIYRNFKSLFIAICLFIAFTSYNIISDNKDIRLYIPNNSKNTTLHYINRLHNKEYIFSIDSLLDCKIIDNISSKVKFKNNINKSTIVTDQKLTENNIIKNMNIINVDNITFALINGDSNNKYSPQKLKINYPIIQKGYKGNIYHLQRLYEFDKVIISTSLSDYYRNKLIKECDSLGIDIFDIKNKGAFIIY